MEFYCDSKYFVLPINYHAQDKRLYFYIGEELVYDLVAAIDAYEPDEKFYINIERFRGKMIRVTTEPEVEFPIELSDTGVGDKEAYCGKYRPLAHFTAKRGWLNDPNGLVYTQGKYLMFYQHNPAACTWENMHWGYAVSHDLVHWEEKDIALYPDPDGTMFSGGAILDKENVTGLKTNEKDVILLFYTAAGSTSETAKEKPFTQCLAYSTDGGETFIKYDKNPLIEQTAPGNRDPKVICHEESGQYIMALYLDDHVYALYASENLLNWKEIQRIRIPEEIECPDFYPLAVDGDPDRQKWVLIGASDKYFLGDFDGTRFVPSTEEPMRLNYGNASYAAQSWSDMPDGRRVRISFFSGELTGMPFGSCMSMPAEMSLKTIQSETKLCIYPAKEIENLYEEVCQPGDVEVNEVRSCEMRLDGKSYDICFRIRPKEHAVFHWSLFGLTLSYDAEKGILSCLDREAPVRLTDGILDIRIVIDTICAEIYADRGSVFMGMYYIQDVSLNKMKMRGEKASVKVEGVKAAKLSEFWKRQEDPCRKEKSPFETIRSEKEKAGRFTVVKDLVRVNGQEQPYDYLEIKEGVSVLPVRDGKIILQRQYRYPVRSWQWEIPGGFVDDGETPKEAAIRELKEETGYEVKELHSLGAFHPSFGSTDEKIHLFSAECGEKGVDAREPGEVIATEEIPIEEFKELIGSGKFMHGAGLAAWARYCQNRS